MRISQNSLLSAAQMNAKRGMGVETPIRAFSLEDLLRGSSLYASCPLACIAGEPGIKIDEAQKWLQEHYRSSGSRLKLSTL